MYLGVCFIYLVLVPIAFALQSKLVLQSTRYSRVARHMVSAEAKTPTPSAIDSFMSELDKSVQNRTLVSLKLGRAKPGKLEAASAVSTTSEDKTKCSIRLVDLQSGLNLQFAQANGVSMTTKNYKADDGLAEIRKLLEAKAYLLASLKTTTSKVEVSLQRGSGRFRVVPSKSEQELVIGGNDIAKQHVVHISSPFLASLNVTTDKGLVKAGMSGKFGQIQKFVEIVDGLVRKHSRRLTPDGKRRLNIVDMGCGLGYLTFACHQHFSKEFAVQTTGVESRFSLVERTNAIASDLQLSGIEFVAGTIETVKPENVDVLIALHACDTATDDSIFQGIAAKSEIILVAPCCHKEARRQMDRAKPTRNSAVADILTHGIYRERMSEMVTDTCRALLLEIAGYETNVFEFVGGEHTAKNVMITAVRLPEPRPPQDTIALEAKYRALTTEYGIKTLKLAALLKLERAA